jgi:hypothetical protein
MTRSLRCNGFMSHNMVVSQSSKAAASTGCRDDGQRTLAEHFALAGTESCFNTGTLRPSATVMVTELSPMRGNTQSSCACPCAGPRMPGPPPSRAHTANNMYAHSGASHPGTRSTTTPPGRGQVWWSAQNHEAENRRVSTKRLPLLFHRSPLFCQRQARAPPFTTGVYTAYIHSQTWYTMQT